MPMANDFLTWPRSFKEQRKKIPQDAAVQRVTYSSSQTKYEAEDTLKNEYNLFKQQTNIPVVWRRNSKGNHPTKKEYLMSPPRNWLRLLRAELSILQSPAPMNIHPDAVIVGALKRGSDWAKVRERQGRAWAPKSGRKLWDLQPPWRTPRWSQWPQHSFGPQ